MGLVCIALRRTSLAVSSCTSDGLGPLDSSCSELTSETVNPFRQFSRILDGGSADRGAVYSVVSD
jgi:hypothetical protein